MKPLAITGMGVACARGIGRDVFFDALASETDLRTLPLVAPRSFAAPEGTLCELAEVPEFDATKYLGDKGLRTLDRLTRLMIVSARLAFADSKIKVDNQYAHYEPTRVGIVTSNAYGSLEAITEMDRVAELEDARYINPAKFPNTVANSASGYVSIWEEARALNVAISGGSTGSFDAFACAEMYLSAKRADAIVLGGAEAMSEALYLAFSKLGLGLGLAPDQDGVRLAEAAAFFALETPKRAAARGAKILAEVTGYGTAFVVDEASESLLCASSVAMQRAVEAAFTRANIDASDVAHVITSSAGIRAFDDAEALALDATIPSCARSAVKPFVGETLGASGALAVGAALAWLQSGKISTHKSHHILLTALGYYGNASALVLRVPGTASS